MRNFILGFTLGAALLVTGQTVAPLNPTSVNPVQIKPPATAPTSPVVIGVTPPSNIYGPMPVPSPTGLSFSDAEIPVGAINGTNGVFSVAFADGFTGKSMILTRNGIVLQYTTDFTLVGKTITFVAGAIPQTGDSLQVWYRY